MKNWLITNISEIDIKISIALGGNNNPGLILKPGDSVISNDKLTGPLDKQDRSNFVEIDKDFDNSSINLPVGIVFSNFKEILKNVKDYKSTN